MIKRGDFVIMPFAFSDGTMRVCHDGPSNVVHPWRIFGTTEVCRSTASRTDSVGGWNTLSGRRALRRRAYGIVTHAFGCDGPDTTPRSSRGCTRRVWPGRAMELWDCAVSLPRSELGAEQIIILGRHGRPIALPRISVRQSGEGPRRRAVSEFAN